MNRATWNKDSFSPSVFVRICSRSQSIRSARSASLSRSMSTSIARTVVVEPRDMFAGCASNCGALRQAQRPSILPSLSRSGVSSRKAGASAWESNPASPRERRATGLKTGRVTGPRSLPDFPYRNPSAVRTAGTSLRSSKAMSTPAARSDFTS